MKGNLKKGLALLIAVFMVFAAVACGNNNSQEQPSQTTAAQTEAAKPTEAANDEVLEITVMSCMNNGEGWYKGGVKEDIVADALAKKTGVRVKQMLTVSSSMKSVEKFNLLYATNEVPEVWTGWIGTGDRNLYDVAEKMMKDDMLWTWTYDELKALAPDAMSMVSPISYDLAKGTLNTGDKVGVLLNRAHGWSPQLAEKYPDFFKANNFPFAGGNMLRFRDDILKAIIPGAKTAAELEELYKKNGKLTWDDVHVPELGTYEGFKNFLYKVKEKYGKEGIIPYGPDQHIMNFGSRVFLQGWHFAEFNPVKMEMMVSAVDKKDEWIGIAKDFNKMFNEGIFDRNYALNTNQQYDEKVGQGKYAVAKDGGVDGSNQVLAGANLPFRYVKVPVSYSTAFGNFDGYQQQEPARCGYGFIFNKKKLNDEQIKKVLGYFNYHATKEGSELITWGPAEAGLWEEKDGKRVWKDPAFVDVITGKKPVGEMKDFAYYGLQPGGEAAKGPGNKYIHEYYFMPHIAHKPFTGDSVPVQGAFSLDMEQNKAFASFNKGYYDELFASWNGTQPMNKVMWDQFNTAKEEINKAICAKPAEFDARMEAFYAFYKDTMKVDEYYQQMKGYIDVVKKYKDMLRFHPNADLSKLN